jgi:hypothetical protein
MYLLVNMSCCIRNVRLLNYLSAHYAVYVIDSCIRRPVGSGKVQGLNVNYSKYARMEIQLPQEVPRGTYEAIGNVVWFKARPAVCVAGASVSVYHSAEDSQ